MILSSYDKLHKLASTDESLKQDIVGVVTGIRGLVSTKYYVCLKQAYAWLGLAVPNLFRGMG
eukprot:scaffold401197_cov15-Prasinocladus_malaysianus.AAC.1